MDVEMVDRVRRFNRTVTQRVGALDDAFLSRDRPLGQARLLWEIGTAVSEVRSLRSRLDLDSGYMSRLLHALQADGLVVVEADDVDGRVRKVRLTPAGLAERAELDQRADNLAASILEPLNEHQRGRLVAAMGEVERLLVASMVRIVAVDPRHRDAQACVEAYLAELERRFDGGHDVTRGVGADEHELALPTGLLLVATLHAEPIGCGALKLQESSCAEVRRMWVAPDVRGLGLGRRLLAELESRAGAHRVRTLRLAVGHTLTEAIGLFRAAGYHEVTPSDGDRAAHRWFEKNLGPAAASGA